MSHDNEYERIGGSLRDRREAHGAGSLRLWGGGMNADCPRPDRFSGPFLSPIESRLS